MKGPVAANWAFGLRGALENLVRHIFPGELRLWPLLNTFDFEGYSIDDEFLVIVLRDKLAGIPAGPGVPLAFARQDRPELPRSADDAATWQQYLNKNFNLREEDAAIIIPIHDSHLKPIDAFQEFTEDERGLWNRQLSHILARQMIHLDQGRSTAPAVPSSIVYNISGTQNRVVVNAIDKSSNIVRSNGVFGDLRTRIAQQLSEHPDREALESSVQELEQAQGTDGFLHKYKEFMALAANHATVFGTALSGLSGLL